ncbi:lysophospholipid acyltransferase family protein [Puniceibacterium sp. IMCC21224]|uniref:lysophospholipid acyltransferase family protein n=1 Tax=Puniceibacterium sp. IMCC21224 TaxID=1618204 RepID=UPI00064DB67C|nr:lysophospholipid acyltransferase family protein [Puniceibacterium sp. IMCC21224]KMK66078.1 putative hemolysin [Puniceibacterium sp. IMCC21224]
MVETSQPAETVDMPRPQSAPYDKRKLSYASTYSNTWKANTIRTVEWLTGKLPLLRLVRRFERLGPADGQAFWGQALGLMGIELRTPPEEIAHIPASGPVIVVANHPHGLVDGMVLAELIGRVRTDYKILTRSLLTGVREIEEFMIPVPFPHEEDAREQSLAMRAQAMEHLHAGGVIVLFPSGVVAASETLFGSAVEQVWNPFTAKMIQRSGATVVPVYFPGQNSRAYQIANILSPTLRQGLLIHEVMHACRPAQARRVGSPVVGAPVFAADFAARAERGRDLVAWLRELTLALADSAR